MTRMWAPGGRAGEQFQRALDGADDAPVDLELLTLVAAIRELPEVAPRPAYAADLRERLMAEADRLAATAPRPVAVPVDGDPADDRLRLRPRREHSSRRRLTVAAGTLAALGVSAGVGVAAQSALPGETLYPLKRALESAETGATVGQTARAERTLGHASDRLTETLAILRDPDAASTAELSTTLDTFSRQAGDASGVLLEEYERTGDRRLVDELRTFTATSTRDLGEMRPVMPAAGQAAWQRASDAVAAIDTDALAACPLCSADLRNLAADAGARTPEFAPDSLLPRSAWGAGADERDAADGERARPRAGERSGSGRDRSGSVQRDPGGTADGGADGSGGADGGGDETPAPDSGGLLDPLLRGDRASGGGEDLGDLADGLLGGGQKGGQKGGGQKGGGSKGQGDGPVGDLLDGVDDLLP